MRENYAWAWNLHILHILELLRDLNRLPGLHERTLVSARTWHLADIILEFLRLAVKSVGRSSSNDLLVANGMVILTWAEVEVLLIGRVVPC